MEAADAAQIPGGAEAAAELGRLLSILHSRTLTDEAIFHFKLLDAYRARSIEEMRELFWNRLASARLVAKEGFVDLVVEDRDPQRAADIANHMAATANELSRRLTSGAAGQQRAFLEQRLEEVRRDMDQASMQYRRFQQENKLVNLEVQADAVIATLLKLKEQLIQEELELRRLQSFASDDEPSIVQLRRQVRELRAKLEALETEQPDQPRDYFTHLDAVPALRVESERLARNLRLKTSVYEMLLREYEMARLSEVRDTKSYEVLDPATVPTRKSRPSRTFVALGIAGVGFGLAFFVAALFGAIGSLRRRHGSYVGASFA